MPFAAHVTTISHVTCAETPVCGAENGLKSALFRPFTALGSEMSRLYKRLPNTLVQSNPSIPPILGLAKKRRYSKNGGIYIFTLYTGAYGESWSPRCLLVSVDLLAALGAIRAAQRQSAKNF